MRSLISCIAFCILFSRRRPPSPSCCLCFTQSCSLLRHLFASLRFSFFVVASACYTTGGSLVCVCVIHFMLFLVHCPSHSIWHHDSIPPALHPHQQAADHSHIGQEYVFATLSAPDGTGRPQTVSFVVAWCFTRTPRPAPQIPRVITEF